MRFKLCIVYDGSYLQFHSAYAYFPYGIPAKYGQQSVIFDFVPVYSLDFRAPFS